MDGEFFDPGAHEVLSAEELAAHTVFETRAALDAPCRFVSCGKWEDRKGFQGLWVFLFSILF